MLTSMSLWRSVPITLIALIFSTFSGRPAHAADESGWFDTPSTNVPQPAPAPPPPAPPPAPQPAEMPSLAPSPLLEESAPPGPAPETIQTDTDPRALSDFRPTLDPYGYWVDHPTYGTVWVPHREVVGTNFAPYVSSGRWALDAGGNWIWVSDYPFGRVVFHYGRWLWITGTGWAWIPGYRYAPAWVSWRVPTGSYAYVGWAPLGPDYVWFNGVAVSYWYGSPVPWVFCPSAYVFHRHVHHYVVRDRVLVTRIAANTRRYAPAAPRASGNVRTTAWVRSPSLASARVPASAVPRERVRAMPARPAALPARQAIPSRPAIGGPTRDRSTGPVRRSYVAPSPPRPTTGEPPRVFRPERGAAPDAAPVRRSEQPRSVEPVRRIEPVRRSEPRRIEPVRRSEPVRRISPPSVPRAGSASPRRALPRSRP